MASSARSRGEVVGRGVDDGADLELEVELGAAARRPDRLVRTADLRHVGEVEDRQPEPGLGDLAAAPRPHRPDVALERVEVAQARRAQDRRPEDEIGRVEESRRRRRPGPVPVDELAERGDPQPGREVVVERPDRGPEERRRCGRARALRRGSSPLRRGRPPAPSAAAGRAPAGRLRGGTGSDPARPAPRRRAPCLARRHQASRVAARPAHDGSGGLMPAGISSMTAAAQMPGVSPAGGVAGSVAAGSGRHASRRGPVTSRASSP